jgi:hypothetical protein
LPVSYGYEKWSLTLREDRGPRMFVNTVLRKMFGPKWKDVTGEWGKLHNAEFITD